MMTALKKVLLIRSIAPDTETRSVLLLRESEL